MTDLAGETQSAEQTRNLGASLAERLAGGDVVLLRGDLGAGKTTFAQGLARGLGIDARVQSPTFTLIAEYDAPRIGPHGQLVHVDLYRLDGVDQLGSIGLDEYLERDDTIVVIEWPDRAGAGAYPSHWSVRLEITGDGKRSIRIQEPGND